MWLIMASWDSFIFNIFLICLIKTGLHFFLSSTIDIGSYYTTPKDHSLFKCFHSDSLSQLHRPQPFIHTKYHNSQTYLALQLLTSAKPLVKKKSQAKIVTQRQKVDIVILMPMVVILMPILIAFLQCLLMQVPNKYYTFKIISFGQFCIRILLCLGSSKRLNIYIKIRPYN